MLLALTTALNNNGHPTLIPDDPHPPHNLVGKHHKLLKAIAVLLVRNIEELAVTVMQSPVDFVIVTKVSPCKHGLATANGKNKFSDAPDFQFRIVPPGISYWPEISSCQRASDVFKLRYDLLVCLYHLLIMYPEIQHSTGRSLGKSYLHDN